MVKKGGVGVSVLGLYTHRGVGSSCGNPNRPVTTPVQVSHSPGGTGRGRGGREKDTTEER